MCTERAYEDLKGELGLLHFEGRSLVTPRGEEHLYGYRQLGRLVRDESPVAV